MMNYYYSNDDYFSISFFNRIFRSVDGKIHRVTHKERVSDLLSKLGIRTKWKLNFALINETLSISRVKEIFRYRLINRDDETREWL